MKKIVIIGTGFAGLTAVKTIRKYRQDISINVISPEAIFNYLPSLIWIPSGLVSRADIQIPLANFFASQQVEHIADEVVGLTGDEQTTIMTKSGQEIQADAVIVASGGQFIKKLPGISHSITPCAGLEAAYQIKSALERLESGTIAFGFSSNPKESQAMRGGPIFEFLFGIEAQLRKEGRRDKFELVFFSPTEKPGARLGQKAVSTLLAEMEKYHITTYLGHKIKGFAANKVMIEGAEFAADLILFMPGMTGNAWFDNTQLARSEGGLLQADKFCQTNFPKVFVAGDSGSFPGPKWMPKQAHMADLQAEAAAKNVLLVLENKLAIHTFKVELMCIVDSLNKGILISRNEKSTKVLPKSWFFHLLKKVFAWWYLRQYK